MNDCIFAHAIILCPQTIGYCRYGVAAVEEEDDAITN